MVAFQVSMPLAAVLLMLLSISYTVSAIAGPEAIVATSTTTSLSRTIASTAAPTSSTHCTTSTSKTTTAKTKTKIKKTKSTSSSATSTPIVCSSTVTANFDTLPTGTGVPQDYPIVGTSWSGFSVQKGSSLFVDTTSLPNVIQTTSDAGDVNPGGSISMTPGGNFTFLSLDSFSFGCEFYYEVPEQDDGTGCSIIVVGAQNYGETVSYVNMVGPFTYGVCDPDYPCNLTTVTSDQLQAIASSSVISFYITSGLSVTQLVLDDLVMTAELIDCVN